MRLFPYALALALIAGPAAADEMAEWRTQAARVSIVRDDWGIAHVKGKTDADAVFGMAYAQAEDDFNRVEANYLTNLGRTAEAAEAYDRAIGLAADPATRQFLLLRRKMCMALPVERAVPPTPSQ